MRSSSEIWDLTLSSHRQQRRQVDARFVYLKLDATKLSDEPDLMELVCEISLWISFHLQKFFFSHVNDMTVKF